MPPPVDTRFTLTVLAGTTLAQVASVMAATTLPSVAPQAAADLGIGASLIGYQVSFLYLAAMSSTALAAGLIRNWGACRMMQASLAMSAIGACCAAIPSMAAILAGSLAMGMALGGLAPASSHLLARFSPPNRRNFFFSFKQTGVPGGGMAAALVAPPITLAFGYRWALVLAGCFAIALALWLQRVRARWDDDREPVVQGASNPLSGLGLMWKTRALRWIAMEGFCFSFVQLCWTTFLVTLLVEEFGYSLLRAGVLLSLTQASGVLSRIAWGLVADRSGNARGVLVIMAAIMVASCVMLAAHGAPMSAALVAALAVSFGISSVGWNGIFLAEVAKLAPAGRVGAATGGVMTLTYGGILVGPAVFSTVYPLIGSYAGTFWLLAAVAGAGWVFLNLCYRVSGQPAV